jgi:glucose-6-phosphate isomerase
MRPSPTIPIETFVGGFGSIEWFTFSPVHSMRHVSVEVCKARLVTNPTAVPAWAELMSLASRDLTVKELIAQERNYLRLTACGISADFSRQRVDRLVLDSLVSLIEQTNVSQLRDSMFRGDHINTTEDRSVLHVALRDPDTTEIVLEGANVVTQVHTVLERMKFFTDRVRDGSWKGVTGKSINRVINIGIGGSDLGPAMANQALHDYTIPGITFAFVSNVDPNDLKQALENSDPETTLFIVVSKTFTTSETMANALTAKQWIINSLPTSDSEQVIARHFVAVSTNSRAVAEFGIDPNNMFEFWDWVGGRYSMDSAVGLSTMIAIGSAHYREMLRGFHAMDEHFRSMPIHENLPMLMGALAVWNRNFLHIETTAVLPYSHYLNRFPAYLQQLTMESNGKRVRKDGSLVTYNTGAIYWGEPGTNGQHSFYQLLHQGTSIVACDFIVIANEYDNPSMQQPILVANALAQASVLSVGVTQDELRQRGDISDLAAHREMPGNRPVTVLMTSQLSPFSLGALISLYEHSVFVQGAIWGINSFDQWGVELGKKVATGIFESFSDKSMIAQFDSSTQASISEYLQMSASMDD